ncbi:MAG TPA: hypothetical protein VN397_01890, partial [Candidatus Methylomirabilis sp.]|nr:hypothetical protein [Candidatus Methylomirabilis sp.]
MAGTFLRKNQQVKGAAMNDDARDIATPIDAYVAVGRRLGLDPGLVIQLRRIGTLNSLSAEEACSMMDAMCAVFGADLAEEILRENPADYRSSIASVEPRVARILNLCQGLNRQDVLRMMRRSPKTFTVNDETFSALIECAAKLIPDETYRWMFLYAFPAYFSLNPIIVSECAARGITEATHRMDHAALWQVLQTEQSARMHLDNLMRELRYNDTLRARYFERLYRDLESYDAGLAFISELLDNGWTEADLREALGAYDHFRVAGSKRITAIQRVLTNMFGMPAPRAIFVFMKKPSILRAEPEAIANRIRAALPFPTPTDVERLLMKAPSILLQDADTTALRRAELIASGKSPDENPTLLLTRVATRTVAIEATQHAPNFDMRRPPNAADVATETEVAATNSIPKRSDKEEIARPTNANTVDDADALRGLSASPHPDCACPTTQKTESHPRSVIADRHSASQSPIDAPFDARQSRDANERHRVATLPTEAPEPNAGTNRRSAAHDEIAKRLGRLGYNVDQQNQRVNELIAWFGTEKAALDVIQKLMNADWNAYALDALLSHRVTHPPDSVERLLKLHEMFIHGFGVNKRVAAYIVSVTPKLAELSVEDVRARIRAALEEAATPLNVKRFVLCAATALQLDATEIASRRANLKARGIRVHLFPWRILQKKAETPPKKRTTKVESEPPPPVETQEKPECATAIQALESAGWTRRDAMLHLRIFTGLKGLDPTQLCHALIRLKSEIGLSDVIFTRRLNGNTRTLVFNRDALVDSYHPSANGNRRSLKDTRERLTPDQTAEAKRIGVGVHALDPDPTRSEHTIREALTVLHLIGFTGEGAKTFLQKYPELLTDDGRPLAVAYWLMTTYQLDPAGVNKNLRDPDARMALFLYPDALREMINERRRLGIEYDDLRMDPSFLDPCITWSRVFCPARELTLRLELLLRMGERPEKPVLNNLHTPSRAAFIRLINDQRV